MRIKLHNIRCGDEILIVNSNYHQSFLVKIHEIFSQKEVIGTVMKIYLNDISFSHDSSFSIFDDDELFIKCSSEEDKLRKLSRMI